MCGNTFEIMIKEKELINDLISNVNGYDIFSQM